MPKLVKIPDIRAFSIGCYNLTATGCTVDGKPSFPEHEGVGDFIRRSHQASGWWLADWLKYGESRPDFREQLEAMLDAAQISMKTAQNVKSIGAKVEPSRRREDVEFSTHAEVAALTPDEQTHWLGKTATEGWTRTELRQNIRAAKRTKVLDGQAVLEGMFRVIYADPDPKLYDSDIDKLPVEAHAMANAVLFLWSPPTKLPARLKTIAAWGFEYKTFVVWDSVHGIHGNYGFEARHQALLIATRGQCLPDAPTPFDDSVLAFRREHEHAGKPEEYRQIITKHWTTGPYLELFGRAPVEGWSVFGSDPKAWGNEHEGAEHHGGLGHGTRQKTA